MNGVKCKVCSKRCANGTGLSAHMRAAHASKKQATKKKATKKKVTKRRKQLGDVPAGPRSPRQPAAPRIPRLVRNPETPLEEIVKKSSIDSMTKRLEKLRQEFLDKAAALGKILNDLADL